MKHEVISVIIGAPLGTIPKGWARGLEELEIGARADSIVEMDQNTEKSPGDLQRLAVTQTPGKTTT